ncbi:MAG: patatin-like phospholipase family protein [bacterium]|nr:patatin-like phospholipase family protein [bacterium]
MNSKKYICIFGGGAIRGVVYPGAVKALEELEIKIPTYVGSSVGAIFAALCSVGYKSSDLSKILHEFNAFMFKDINFSIGKFSLSKGEIFENWLREKIEASFYGDSYKKGENEPVKFSDISKDLFILSTDIKTNRRFVFSRYSSPEFEVAKAIRISSSFPGLMKPAEIDDKILVDGDLAKSLPLWKVLKNLMIAEYLSFDLREIA